MINVFKSVSVILIIFTCIFSSAPAFEIENVNPGQIVNFSELGIDFCFEGQDKEVKDNINIVLIPKDFDIQNTEIYPYLEKFGYLHLNLPTLPETESKFTTLIMSDYPETVSDSNWIMGSDFRSAEGIYCQVKLEEGYHRLLIDHLNLSSSRKFLKAYLTSPDMLQVKILGWGEGLSPQGLIAGSIQQFRFNVLRPLKEIKVSPENSFNLVGEYINNSYEAKMCAVCLYEFYVDRMCFLTVVIEDEDKVNPSFEEINALEKQSALKWRTKKEILKKYLNPEIFPARYNRILKTCIHARGLFLYPDQTVSAVYDFSKSNIRDHFYSTNEALFGLDQISLLVRAAAGDIISESRGRYGGWTSINFKFKSLPPDCSKVALFMLNGTFLNGPEGVMGGIFKVKHKYETNQFFYDVKNLISPGQGVLLWKGRIQKEDCIKVSYFPLNNASVRPLYLIAPVK